MTQEGETKQIIQKKERKEKEIGSGLWAGKAHIGYLKLATPRTR